MPELNETEASWLWPLRSALRHRMASAPETLGLGGLIHELSLIATSASLGIAPGSRADVRSLADDVKATVRSVGPQLRATLVDLEAHLDRELNQLGGLLGSARTAKTVATTARVMEARLQDKAATKSGVA